MGLKDLLKRSEKVEGDLDQVRRQERFIGVKVTHIDEALPRTPIRIAGEIQRVRSVPRSGSPWLEICVNDGTADAMITFTGTKKIAGIQPGRGLVLEGVGRVENGKLVMLNPAYTLLP